MRKIRQLLLAVIVSTAIISCSKDDVDDKDKDQEPLKNETISGKWNVDGTSQYKSFEFNEGGSFIIVERLKVQATRSTEENEKVYFGTYEITDNRTILLPGFGKMRVSSVKGNMIIFSLYFTTNPNDEIVLKATKQKEMESTNRTKLLCRTWKTVTLNGEDVAGTDDEVNVVFSNAGTYLVDGDEGLGIARWQWTNSKEEYIHYSWGGLEPPVWDNKVKIVNLTASSLTFLEEFDDDDDDLWVLKAVINQQSKSAISEVKPTVNKMKGSLLGR